MKTCFLCSTPYQIFTAINIKYSNLFNSQVDIYIYDYFKNAGVISQKVIETRVFDNVILCPFKEVHEKLATVDSFERYLSKLKYYLIRKEKLTRYLLDSSYQMVLFSNQDPVNEILIRYFYKKNKEIRICHFEDGWLDYTFESNKFYTDVTKKRNAFWKTPEEFFKRNISYFYNPDLVDPDCSSELIRIICDNPEGRRAANTIFDYNDNARINTSVLYFDTLEENLLGASVQEHLTMLKELKKYFNATEITIKKHPRNFSDLYYEKGYNVYGMQAVPFEVVCQNQDFSSKLLISTFSTACFTPKILFGQEPFVILLYKLVCTNGEVNYRTKRFLERVQENYQNKDKIIIPETYEELDRAIKYYIQRYR